MTPRGAALHRNFQQATVDLKRDIVRVVYFLERVSRHRIHAALGFRTIEEYADRVAGFSPAQTHRFLHLGRRLHGYSEVARALGKGQITFSKALLICTRARPEDQRHLVDAARELTTRQLRRQLLLASNPGRTGETSEASLFREPQDSASETALPPSPRDDHLVRVATEDADDAASGCDRDVVDNATANAGGDEAPAAVPATTENPMPIARRPAPSDDGHKRADAAAPSPASKPAPNILHVSLRFTAEQYQKWSALLDHHR